MGAEDINFPDNSFTHIGCMFGIMFFSDRAKGLAQMHRVLAPKGTAVIGTWQLSELISIVEDFGKYLQLPHLEKDMTAVAAQVAICSDIKVFEEELSIAGFKDISITPYEHVFSLSNDMDTYISIASNAVLSKALGKDEAIHEHAQSWIDFMNTPEARAKYISPDVAYMYGSLRTLLLLRNNVILDTDTYIILCLYHIINHIICIYIVFYKQSTIVRTQWMMHS